MRLRQGPGTRSRPVDGAGRIAGRHASAGRSPGADCSAGPPPVSDPEVVAHRGATADAPEHTLAAYRHAAAIGADAVECDVRMTRDGVLVCVHDRQIRRTSNGRGVVSALHLAELEQFQFGARRRRRQPWADDEITAVTDEPDVQNGLVLSLDRLLEYITASPGGVRLAIETKHPTRHASKVEEELVSCLRRYGLLGPRGPAEWAGKPAVRVMSFSPLAVRRMHDLASTVPTVQLIGKRLRPVRRELLGVARPPSDRAWGCCGRIRCSSPTPMRRARRCTSGRSTVRATWTSPGPSGPTRSSPTTRPSCCAGSAATSPLPDGNH